MVPSRCAFVLGALVGAVIGGCGGGAVDTAGLEDELKPQIEERLGLAVKAVDCPDDVRVSPRSRFECRFTTLAGERDVVPVLQRDGELSYQLPPTQ